MQLARKLGPLIWTKLINFVLEMVPKNPYGKARQTKWLLTVALFLSLFSFSGYTGISQTLQEATQTELVLSDRKDTTKRAVHFYDTLLADRSESGPVSKTCLANYLLSYNRLVEIRFKNLSEPPGIRKLSDHFYQVKTIPQSSKEDNFVSSIG